MRPLFAITLFTLAGCSLGGGVASVERGELAKLVLQPDDLSRAFLRFDEGRQIMADSRGGHRADPDRFGRLGGWKSRYRRGGTPQTAGPLVIESRADLFDSAAGAEDDFNAAREDLKESELGWNPIDEPGLGDESFAATYVQSALNAVRYYQVFWRHDNATASIDVNGFDGKLALADVLELARKQERRIARSASP
jgi:hypothetical protein